MRIRKFMGIAFLLVTSFVGFGAAPEKSQLEVMYDKAFRAFDKGNYEEALKTLDAIDQRQPGLAESLNLRGVVYMRQKRYDKAETVLHKAVSIEPKFWNARFNLAEIPFLKKDWPEARKRFESLVADDNQNAQPSTGQLIRYKILLTFILQGEENIVDSMTSKFELTKDSPAVYYANAARAFQQGNRKDADEWLSTAKKHFSDALNKLYTESFYEIGWMEKPLGESPAAIEITSATEPGEHLQADARANFEQAERAFEQHDLEGALKSLGLAEAAVPNDAQFDNLKGEILIEQGKFDEAEIALRKAFDADPKFREAEYNLAQIPFKRGEYSKARDRFETLFAETPADDKNQASQLIKYKIFLTLLLDGKEDEAQQLMDQFKFTGDTPALYYAHAAWEFKHGHEDEGSGWLNSAAKIYSAPLNLVFADSFYDLGWLKRSSAEASPIVPLAQANASPPGPTPAMQLGPTESLLAPEPSASASPAAAVIPVPTMTVANSSPAANSTSSLPDANDSSNVVANSSPVSSDSASTAAPSFSPVSPDSVASAEPESSPNNPDSASTGAANSSPVNTASAPTAANNSSPVNPNSVSTVGNSAQPFTDSSAAADNSSAVSAQSSIAAAKSPAAAVTAPPLEVGNAPPVPSIASESSPTAQPRIESAATKTLPQKSSTTIASLEAQNDSIGSGIPGIFRPAALVAGSVILFAMFLVGWLLVRHARRDRAGSDGSSPDALTTSRLVGEKREMHNQDSVQGDFISGGAPKISLDPRESKSVRGTALNGPAVSPNDQSKVEAELPKSKGSEPDRSLPPVVPSVGPGASAAMTNGSATAQKKSEVREPLRDKEEVSLPAISKTEAAASERVEASLNETEPAIETSEPLKTGLHDYPEALQSIAESAPIDAPSESTPLGPAELKDLEHEKVEPEKPQPANTETAKVDGEKRFKDAQAKTDSPVLLEEGKPASAAHESIGQSAPLPQLVTAPDRNPAVSEGAEIASENSFELVESEEEITTPGAIHGPAHSAIEHPTFASTIISTEGIRLTRSLIMSETTITPGNIPATRPAPAAVSMHEPTGSMRTTVQLTFSLEIASMQLTPTFKMSDLHLKPVSRVVSMRLASAQDPQPQMNLQATFEVTKIELTNGAIATVRLVPSIQQKPAVLTSPSLSISGVEFVSEGVAPLQLTPSHQEDASVHLTAEFQIAAIEFTPRFEIASIVLHSTSKKVLMQLPGSGASSIDNAPLFEIEEVQLNDNSELGLIQVIPEGSV